MDSRSDQAWFWTADWQAGERAAEADLALGNYETFDSAESFIESLGD